MKFRSERDIKMRKNIQAAYSAAINGKSYSTKNGSLSVKEGIIRSYAMEIGRLINGNEIEVTSEKAPSKTTACHIKGLRFLADR
jgi:hypothetical protein